MSRMALRMKAMRQPQFRKASSVSSMDARPMTPEASRRPTDMPDLGQAGIEGTLVGGRGFEGHEHGPAPFAAEPDALCEAAQDEQYGRPMPMVA